MSAVTEAAASSAPQSSASLPESAAGGSKDKGKKPRELAITARKLNEAAAVQSRAAKENDRIMGFVHARLQGGATPAQLREELFQPVSPSAVRQFVKDHKAWSREHKDTVLEALESACARGDATQLKYAILAKGQLTFSTHRWDVRDEFLNAGTSASRGLVLWTDVSDFAVGDDVATVDSDDEDDTCSKAWKSLYVSDSSTVEDPWDGGEDGEFPTGGRRRAASSDTTDNARALELLEVQRKVVLLRFLLLEMAVRKLSKKDEEMERDVQQCLPTAAMMLDAHVRRLHTERLANHTRFDDLMEVAPDLIAHSTLPAEQPSDAAPDHWFLQGVFVRLSDEDARRAVGPLVACVTAGLGPTRATPGWMPAVTFEYHPPDVISHYEVVDQLSREGVVLVRNDVPSWDPRHFSNVEYFAALGEDVSDGLPLDKMLYSNTPPTEEQLEAAHALPSGLAVRRAVRNDVLRALRALCHSDLLTIRTVHTIKRFLFRCGGLKLAQRHLNASLLLLSTVDAVRLAHYVRDLWDANVLSTRDWQEVEDLVASRGYEQFVSLRQRHSQGGSPGDEDWLIHTSFAEAASYTGAGASQDADTAARDALLDDVRAVLHGSAESTLGCAAGPWVAVTAPQLTSLAPPPRRPQRFHTGPACLVCRLAGGEHGDVRGAG